MYVTEGLSPSALAARAGSMAGLVVCSAQVHVSVLLVGLCPAWPQSGFPSEDASTPCSILQNQNPFSSWRFCFTCCCCWVNASNDALSCLSLSLQYVIKTVEVESSKTKQALSESQTRNQHLQEQVAMQRQVLKEMEQQLQNSHQLTVQLRAQVCAPRGL